MAVLLIQVTLAKHVRLKSLYLWWNLRIGKKGSPILLFFLRCELFYKRIRVILCKIDTIWGWHVHDNNVVFVFILDRFSLLLRGFSPAMRRAVCLVLVETYPISYRYFTLYHLLDLVFWESAYLHWEVVNLFAYW